MCFISNPNYEPISWRPYKSRPPSSLQGQIPNPKSRIPATQASESSLIELLGDVFGRAHRERKDGPRAVLVRIRHERTAVGNDQVLHVVRLAVVVVHICRRVR